MSDVKVTEGTLVRSSASFTDPDGAAGDPVAVIVFWKAPDGTISEYVYGTDPEVVRDSLGHYHMDLVPAAGSGDGACGQWWVRWEGVGFAVRDDYFYVSEGQF